MNPVKFYILLFFFLVSKLLHSQESNIDSIPARPMNSFNITLGDASGLSVGYERLFKIGENFFLAGKIGLGLNKEFRICIFSLDCQKPAEKYISVPASLTINYGENKSFLEVGIGGSKLHGNIDQHYWIYPIIAYRAQPLIPGRFNFRVFAAFPFSGYENGEILFLPFGISTGVVF